MVNHHQFIQHPIHLAPLLMPQFPTIQCIMEPTMDLPIMVLTMGLPIMPLPLIPPLLMPKDPTIQSIMELIMDLSTMPHLIMLLLTQSHITNPNLNMNTKNLNVLKVTPKHGVLKMMNIPNMKSKKPSNTTMKLFVKSTRMF